MSDQRYEEHLKSLRSAWLQHQKAHPKSEPPKNLVINVLDFLADDSVDGPNEALAEKSVQEIPVNMLLPEDLLEEIEHLAQTRRCSRDEVICSALRQYCQTIKRRRKSQK